MDLAVSQLLTSAGPKQAHLRFRFFQFNPIFLFKILAIRSLQIGPQMSYLVCGQNACYSPKNNLATAASSPSVSVIDDVRCHVITLDHIFTDTYDLLLL